MSEEKFVETIISLGSNIEKERYLPEAIRLLRRHRRIEVRKVSRFFESAPVGGPEDSPDFFNAAMLACTDLPPQELRAALRHIEKVLGRERTEDKNAPRTIDLDIVYYGDLVESYDDWQLPDPAAATEPHVAIPIADVAPTWVDPVSNRTAYDIMLGVDAATESVKPVMSITLAQPYEARGPEEFDQTGDVYAPKLEAIVRAQLLEIGENPDREGLVRTPLRVAKAMDFLTNGYSTSLSEVVNNAVFDAEDADEMVLVKDIEFYSMCEHHMLPFFGKAAVAYIPRGKIIGLSKVARVVDLYARRLQVQERLTNQVAAAIDEILKPQGVGVVIEGQHLCMMMRGVQKQDSSTITSAMRGNFKSDPRTRSEFIELSKG
jgi:GTP cyclohydrolase I